MAAKKKDEAPAETQALVSNADLDLRYVSRRGEASTYVPHREGVDEDAGPQVAQLLGVLPTPARAK